jgi:alcohol dehydrogenase
MQLGAYYAGVAIENSMLGATHACANPLTARFGTTHGEAIALLLPTVVRWNGAVAAQHYGELTHIARIDVGGKEASEALARRIEELARVAALPASLSAVGIPRSELQMLAEEAATQWTGKFNPRPFEAAGALEVYEWAY